MARRVKTGREQCLDLARGAAVERGDTYGIPGDFFALVAARWSQRFGVPVTARQVALCQIDMKIVRADAGLRGDTAVDIAGYAACLFEIDGSKA